MVNRLFYSVDLKEPMDAVAGSCVALLTKASGCGSRKRSFPVR